jgi:tRNA(adenine34) deaminase
MRMGKRLWDLWQGVRTRQQPLDTASALSDRASFDEAMMRRCIALSRQAADAGDLPFASVLTLDGEIVAEAVNRARLERNVAAHAEVIAISRAQKKLGFAEFSRATLYTNVEPCAMCAYCIREVGLGRVVFAIASPVMGGLSHWNILRDETISRRIPQVFGSVPEVVSGLGFPEAQAAWRQWNPLAWQLIQLRVGDASDHAPIDDACRRT